MINWISEVLSNTPYGYFTREFTAPILKDLKLIPNEPNTRPENKINDSTWVESLNASMLKPEGDISINFCMPTNYVHNPSKFNIGMTLWDTDVYPKEWIQSMSRMDAFMVPTEDMKDAILKTGIKKPVAKFNPYLNTSKWAGTDVTKVAGTENHIRFFFDGNWVASNDFESLILGYCIAFEGIKDVSLIINTSTQDDVKSKEHIMNAVRSICSRVRLMHKPNIVLLMEKMPEEDLCKVIRGCHHYISVSKGSAVDVGKIRAACCGLPIAAIGGSEYPADKLIASTKEPIVGQPVPLYSHYQQWNRVDMSDYIQKLRNMYSEIKQDIPAWENGSTYRSGVAKSAFQSTDLVDVAKRLAKENGKLQETQKGQDIIANVVKQITQ